MGYFVKKNQLAPRVLYVFSILSSIQIWVFIQFFISREIKNLTSRSKNILVECLFNKNTLGDCLFNKSTLDEHLFYLKNIQPYFNPTIKGAMSLIIITIIFLTLSVYIYTKIYKKDMEYMEQLEKLEQKFDNIINQRSQKLPDLKKM